MDNDKLRDISGLLRHIDHQIDNLLPILDNLDRDPVLSRPARKYKAVNLRVNMQKMQYDIKDFLMFMEVLKYEESENNSNLST